MPGAVPIVRVGMVGGGYIGGVHSLAMRVAGMAHAPLAEPRLLLLCERDPKLAEAVARRYSWAGTTADWRDLVVAPIDLFVNAGPNAVHVEPTIAAAQRGLDVFCEKPLAATADEALRLFQETDACGVQHRCAYVHRFVPALQLARRMIAAGDLGEIRHFRSAFLMNMVPQDQPLTWRFDRARAGSGAVADLGSHHIDVARFLVGEVETVFGRTDTWSSSPDFDANDDAYSCVATLAGGATATFTGSRVAGVHALTGTVEVDGSHGSVAFSMERFNELRVRTPSHGWETRMVTGPTDPYADFLHPVGIQGAHPAGWQDCFAHQIADMLATVAGTGGSSLGATFRDGYRVAEIVAAIERSSQTGEQQTVTFRDHHEALQR